MIFSVLAALINLIPIPCPNLVASLTGVLEITTGIHNVAALAISQNLKIVFITTIAAFGGLSGFAQTKSVFSTSGLSRTTYLFTKVLSAIIAFILTTVFTMFL